MGQKSLWIEVQIRGYKQKRKECAYKRRVKKYFILVNEAPEKGRKKNNGRGEREKERETQRERVINMCHLQDSVGFREERESDTQASFSSIWEKNIAKSLEIRERDLSRI